MNDNDAWIDVRQAAEILKVSERQVNNYGRAGRLPTKRVGPRRTLYDLHAVEQLAEQTGASDRPGRKTIPRAEMIPVRDVLAQISQAQQRVGFLEGQLELLTAQQVQQQKLLEAGEMTRRELAVTQERLAVAEREVQALRAQLSMSTAPVEPTQPVRRRAWWRRLLG